MKLIEQLTIIAVALLSLTAIGGCVTLILWIVELLNKHRARKILREVHADSQYETSSQRRRMIEEPRPFT